MKCSLGISNVLEEISSLSHSVVFLYFFALIAEENSRMGKTGYIFKEVRAVKRTFHANMGTIDDKNDTDITKTEDIKRWQEYVELYQKDLHDSDNYDGVITYLEPEILKRETSGPQEA